MGDVHECYPVSAASAAYKQEHTTQHEGEGDLRDGEDTCH